MTKLYHGAEGWQVPGKQDRKAERADVPNGPAELAAWLNDRHVKPAPIETDHLDEQAFAELAEAAELAPVVAGNDKPKANPRCPACHRTEAGAAHMVMSNDVDTIVDWIMDTAPQWAVVRLFEALGTRFGETRR